jgi:hypothetical protein
MGASAGYWFFSFSQRNLEQGFTDMVSVVFPRILKGFHQTIGCVSQSKGFNGLAVFSEGS